MIQLPDLHELTWLFDAEPVLADADVPVAYNTVTLSGTRGQESIQCVIRPAYDEVELVWSQSDEELVRMALAGVAALDVLRQGDRELVRISFSAADLQPLHLRIRPTIYLAWQMADR